MTDESTSKAAAAGRAMILPLALAQFIGLILGVLIPRTSAETMAEESSGPEPAARQRSS